MFMTPQRGNSLGPYELISPLGEGGMGEVWKARDTRLDRTVAIKFSKEEFSERFDREARAVAALNHPNICQLYDVGPNYLVMEFIEGTPIKGPLPVDKAVEYAGQILDALDSAHKKGITHRDLKPDNILLAKQGVKLLDFGLAKQSGPLAPTDATLTNALTAKGEILGTLHYMSPEQLQGREADARSDIFSFGCVLYEMLSGKRAFEGSSAASVIAAILEREPTPLELSPPLDRVIRTCLAKDPDQRFHSAVDLKRALGWSITATTAGAPAQPTTRPRNRRVLIGIAVGLVAGALLAVLIPRQEVTGTATRVSCLTATEDPEGSPAFSPNGRMLAFRRDAAGESRIGFLDLESRNTMFVRTPGIRLAIFSPLFWSRDGSRVYYRNGEQLWQVSAAGGTPTLTLEGVVVAAPEPSRDALLFARRSPDGTLEFFRCGLRGENIERVPGFHLPPGAVSISFSLSPDSTKAAAVAVNTPVVSSVPNLAWRPFGEPAWGTEWWPDSRHLLVRTLSRKALLYDTETGARRLVFVGPEALASPAAVSPDATRIVFASNSTYSAVQEFAPEGQPGAQLSDRDWNAVECRWSKDGKTMVVGSRVDENRVLWIRTEGSDALRRVSKIHYVSRFFFPAVSWDGTRVAYSLSGELRIVAAGGGSEIVAAKLAGDVLGNDWSPDGKWILSARGNKIYKVAAESAASVDVLAETSGNVQGVCWTRNGIYFGAANSLFRIDENPGAKMVRIGPLAGPLQDCSADGSRAYTLDTAPDGYYFVVMDASTGVEIKRARLKTNLVVRSLSVHPGGQRIAAYVQAFRSDLWMLEGFPRPATGWRRLFQRWVEPEADQAEPAGAEEVNP